jgi:ATP-dependent DNA helicase DinG
MTHPLGQWAVIDIETTGTDPGVDEIIDIGFLKFEGTQFLGKTSSLIRYPHEVSQFIKKLTGISSQMLKKAPRWKDVEPDVMELEGHHLIAHNASFEASFLRPLFENYDAYQPEECLYEDSLPFLGLIFPRQSRLGLENFIVAWELREGEVHRGLEDSQDLLKVILGVSAWLKTQSLRGPLLEGLLHKHRMQGWWFAKFLDLSLEELNQLAESVDLDLDSLVEKIELWHQGDKEIEAQETQESSLFDFNFSGENIKKIWSDEESVAQKFPGYIYRKSQEDLSLRVGQSFKNKVHSLVQAPTGTGKTLGYLLPAALFSMQEKQQVLMATGTKTLQHQAMTKDVPALRKLLGLKDDQFKVRSLIGSQNHFCELLYRQAQEEETSLLEQHFEQQWVKTYLDHLFYLNSEAAPDEILTRGDIAYVLKKKFPLLEQLERESAVDYRSCTGPKCPYKNQCGYLRGLREAREADLIVGNHALMFSWTRAFPRPAYVIVDEAHKIEQEATSAATMEVTYDLLKQMSKNLQNTQGLGSLFYLLAQFEHERGSSTGEIQELRQKALDVSQTLDDHLNELPDKIELYAKKKPRYTSIFWNEYPCPGPKERDSLAVGIYHHFESLIYVLTGINQTLLRYRGRWDVKSLNEDNQIVALTRFETFADHLEDLEVALSYALGVPEPKPGYASSLKFHEQHGFALSASPIDVGKFLHDSLLQTSASVVMTSATLANAKGDLGAKGVEWATGYSYLDSSRRFKNGFYLPSAYDYKDKTKIFLCDDVPRLNAPEFVPQVIRGIAGLINELEGRCLLLFSARSRFEQARELLLEKFEGKIPVFIQGMGNDVVEDFKRAGRGILLGMESFGEGIDVPGEGLQFVFIDKIPDLRMDYVIQKRRDFYDANLGNEFTDYYLAHRTRSLHQKLGRLLRTENDYGGVIVVDSRIKNWKGRTMETLHRLMEPYELNRAALDQACKEVAQFIQGDVKSEEQAPTLYP